VGLAIRVASVLDALPLRWFPVVLLLALMFPAAAQAHATLVRSDPRDGAVLAAAPTTVRLVFDDTVRAVSGMRAIRNGDGSVLSGRPHVVNGRVLVVPLRGGLPDGDYTVLWRVLSDDGHRLAGVIAFGVGAGRAPPIAALNADNGPSFPDVLSRWLFFAGLLTAAGAAFYRFVVGPVPPRLFLVAFLLVLVGASSAIHDVSVSTRFGGVMLAASVIAGVGALFAAVTPLFPPLGVVPALAGLLLVPVPTIAGHALDPGRSWIEAVADVVHVAAASLWLGGLVSLALALRGGADRRATLRRFSNLALVSVLVLAGTGVIRALAELDSVSQIWSTGYGRVLVLKTALLTALVAIGWVNRYRLVPQNAVGALRRSTSVELALFVVLVAAVALLTDLRPGRGREASAAVAAPTGPPPLPGRQMVVQAREDGELAVALAVHAPGAEVAVLGPDGKGVNGLNVTIAGTRARSCGAGCYGAFVRTARKITVTVNGRKLVFAVPAKLRPANAIVARATDRFRRLRSVEYVERLASSPRNRVVADFTLERPNRLEYRIRGGAAGIIIGSRRWDRVPGGKWQASAQEPTPQPEPIWAGQVTNAYLLSSTPSTYVVSFLKPVGPAWFTLVLDRRTMLPRTLRMTAAAHFMHHRYSHFNTAPRIKQPVP
jgi:copper transport protein